ncbi:unnamed protein product [Rhizophagus irregularis]|nr:unnamed protein product [Rhizophagus irregularis]
MNEMKIDNINSYEKEIKYKEPLIRQVNHGPFSDDEKNYIYEWANNRTKNCDAIRWEFLQIEIQNNFGKFRLRNDLKYQWNCRRRYISRKSTDEITL